MKKLDEAVDGCMDKLNDVPEDIIISQLDEPSRLA